MAMDREPYDFTNFRKAQQLRAFQRRRWAAAVLSGDVEGVLEDLDHINNPDRHLAESGAENLAFGALAQKGASAADPKEILDTATVWSDLLRKARTLPSSPVRVARNESSRRAPETSFDEPVLRVAFAKAVKFLQKVTGLSHRDCCDEALRRLSADASALRSPFRAVRFLQGASADWFRECPQCGREHEPPWSRCDECGWERG